MDPIQNRLSDDDAITRMQAVLKLFKLIDVKFGKQMFEEKNEKSDEMILMYGCISSEDFVVSSTSCQLALSRIFEQPAQILYFLNKLEIMAYTTKNSKAIIEAILQILIYSDQLIPNYKNINNDLKTLVKIVKTKPADFIHIKDFYLSRKLENKNFDKLLKILQPLINYIFLGVDTVNKLNLQLSITQCFLHNSTKLDLDLIYFYRIMPWFNLKSFLDYSLIDVLHLLASSISQDSHYLKSIDVDGVVVVVLELIIKMNLNSKILLQDIILLLDLYPKEFKSLNVFLLAACSLIQSHPTFICLILQLVERILKMDKEKRVLNVIICSALILPILHLFIIPPNIVTADTINSLHQVFDQLTIIVQQPCPYFSYIKRGNTSFANEILSLVGYLSSNEKNIISWLQNVVDINFDLGSVSYEACCIICALLVRTNQFEQIQLCLIILVKICKINMHLSCQMLQLIIFKLKIVRDPYISHLLLSYLPKLMISKMCLNQIQSLILHMFESGNMKAQAIKMASEIWLIHPSTTPFLLDLLSKVSNLHLLSTQLSRIDAIRLMCEIAADKHGEELLHYISEVFHDKTNHSSVVYLALKSLYQLCFSEVIDLETTWNVMGHKLLEYKEPIVLKELCNFISLASLFNYENIDYQIFKTKVLNILWSLTKFSDGQVSLSAFKSISNFSFEDIESITFEPDYYMEVNTFPAHTIVSLFTSSSPTFISGPECFISQLVKYELEKMPHAITFESNRCHYETPSNVVLQIPSFIQTLLTSSKHIDIQPTINAAQLFTFDVEISRDNSDKPNISSIKNRRALYMQTFTNLLNTSDFDFKDDIYHGCIFFESFRAFIERLVSAILEDRFIEITSLRRSNKIDSEEEKNLKLCSILWSRDKIYDIIKNLKKNSISSQVNSLYALSGLAYVVSSHLSLMDADTLASANDSIIEHTKPMRWLEILFNSYFSLLAPNQIDSSRIFHFFKNFSYTNMNIKSAALLSLSSIGNLCSEFMYSHLFDFLNKFLTNFKENEHSYIFELFGGISVAYFVNGFIMSSIVQSSCSNNKIAMMNKLYILMESLTLNDNVHQPGIIYGYSMIVSSACLNGYKFRELNYENICQNIMAAIATSNDRNNKKYIAELLFCLSNIAGSAYLMNQISYELSNECLELIYSLNKKYKVSHAIGNLLYFLLSASHTKARELFPNLYSAYIMDSSDQILKESVNFLVSLNGMIRINNGISAIISEAFIKKKKVPTATLR